MKVIVSINFILFINLTFAQVPIDIKDNIKIINIDFYNFTFPGFNNIFWSAYWLSNQKENDDYELIPDFTLVDGELWREWHGRDENDKYYSVLKIENIFYGDFNNDGILDVLIQMEYEARTASGKSEYLAYIYSIKESKLHLLNKFGEVPGVFSENNLIEGWDRWQTTVKNNKIYVSDDLNNGTDRCCPIYRAIFEGEYISYNEIKWSLSLKDRSKWDYE
jgi:hypothetical protein